MYWRIRKFTPEMFVKAYGIYVVCCASILCNVFLISKATPGKGLTAQQKADFTVFAKQVTQHLTDTNFLTYETSMSSLAFNKKHELDGTAIKQLSTEEVVPANPTAMRAMARQLKEKKCVSCASIDEITVGDPDPGHNNWVPADVSGRLVQHSIEGVNGPAFFRFQYFLAMVGAKDDPTMTWPAVVEFKDRTNEGAPQRIENAPYNGP